MSDPLYEVLPMTMTKTKTNTKSKDIKYDIQTRQLSRTFLELALLLRPQCITGTISPHVCTQEPQWFLLRKCDERG